MQVVRLSVLIVEDDDDVRDLLVEAIATEGGFLVRTAATISQARALMAECGESFAIAVLDISLPDGDGCAFCASLRRQGFQLPVILLSGLGHEDDIARGFKTGADDCLAKPFGIAELLASIDAQLHQAELRAVAVD